MKKFQMIILVALILITSIAGASERYQHFKVTAFDRGIAVLLDGRQMQISTKPLVINGKVMVSVRDIAYIFNKNVVWNGKYNLLNLGSGSKVLDFPTDTQLTEKPKPVAQGTPYNVKYLETMKVLRNIGPFYQLAKRKVAIGGVRFDHGLVVDLDPTNSAQTTADQPPKTIAEAKIYLGGNYTGIDGKIGIEDSSRNSKAGLIIRIYTDALLRYESEVIEPGNLAFTITKDDIGDLSNVKILKIELEYQPLPGTPGVSSKTKAALANFKFYRNN